MSELTPWAIEFSCCGREDGVQVVGSWQEADDFRESYTSGYAVDPHGYSGIGWGHKRAGIVRRAPAGLRLGYHSLAEYESVAGALTAARLGVQDREEDR